ncbi:hypothetical protein WDU94_003086 [Cyamophila willieti]
MGSVCNEIIEDIEDLIASQDIPAKERYSNKSMINVRVKKQKNKTEYPVPDCSSIPGTQTIYVHTWGCTHNSSDSEYMAGQLVQYGYKITDDKTKADLWLLNSCTVKNPAVDHFRNEIEAGRRQGKHIVLAGCVPQGAPKADFIKGLSIIGVQQIDRVVEVVEETLKGHSVRLLGQKKKSGKKLGGAPLQLPKVRKNPLIEIIPINTGCLNQCTYCKTKHARGHLGSYPPEEIVARAKQCFTEGVVEVWLTSEDTGTYGRDIDSSLPSLLWELIGVIPKHAMLRVGMTNPPYILEHLEEMAKILNHPRVYAFLHIPVQSGSDQVLADMKREYTRDEFEHVVRFLSERVPGLTIATDIICGFPTETEQDFADTLSLCAQYKFPSLFINQFFPRPGTPAAKMPLIPTQEVKKRTKKLNDLFQSYSPYEHLKGSVQRVLITDEAFDGVNYIGHNKFYQQVIVPKLPDIMGRWADVLVVETKKHCLIGKIMLEGQVVDPEEELIECSMDNWGRIFGQGKREFNVETWRELFGHIPFPEHLAERNASEERLVNGIHAMNGGPFGKENGEFHPNGGNEVLNSRQVFNGDEPHVRRRSQSDEKSAEKSQSRSNFSSRNGWTETHNEGDLNEENADLNRDFEEDESGETEEEEEEDLNRLDDEFIQGFLSGGCCKENGRSNTGGSIGDNGHIEDSGAGGACETSGGDSVSCCQSDFMNSSNSAECCQSNSDKELTSSCCARNSGSECKEEGAKEMKTASGYLTNSDCAGNDCLCKIVKSVNKEDSKNVINPKEVSKNVINPKRSVKT